MSRYTEMTDEQKKAHRAAHYKWRKNNPKKRQEGARRNYQKGAPVGTIGSVRREWTPEEDAIVLRDGMTDRERAAEILRTVSAIQQRRHKLKERRPITSI